LLFGYLRAQGSRLNLVEAPEFAASVQQAYADAGYPLVNAVLQPRAFARGENQFYSIG
jgi:hypothetical protein